MTTTCAGVPVAPVTAFSFSAVLPWLYRCAILWPLWRQALTGPFGATVSLRLLNPGA
jgi:hypothetical protein